MNTPHTQNLIEQLTPQFKHGFDSYILQLDSAQLLEELEYLVDHEGVLDPGLISDLREEVRGLEKLLDGAHDERDCLQEELDDTRVGLRHANDEVTRLKKVIEELGHN
jgi:hypothetical protein